MTISLVSSLNRSAILEGEPARVWLLIQVMAEAEAAPDRPTLNLAAVMDRSGSMEGRKLDYTRTALSHLVDQTAPADFLSLIAFDSRVQTLFPADHVANKDALKATVAGLTAGSTTNLSGGLLTGYRQAGQHLTKGWVNRVLLMTDGQANVGVVEPQALAAKAREMNEKGIQLSTMGVGEDFNEDLLTAMAEAGGGNFYYIADPDQIPAILARELQGLLATVAQGLEVRFTAAPGVSICRVVGYPPTGSAAGIQMVLPDIYAGEVKSLVLELDVPASFAGQKGLGRLELVYSGAGDGAEQNLTQETSVHVTADRRLLEEPEDPAVLKALHLARSAEALDRAVEAADQQDFTAGSQALREAAAPLQAVADATGDAALQARVAELNFQADALEARLYDAHTRKAMRAQSFQTRTGRRER